ncbi:MAG: methyltransferase domain-containing protein [Pseudomonadales bacterium]|jgi:SAM-dependent methyltransferase|nr:methyltransferase domain-containing protein [Pseudomonadales bacterium]
MKECSKSIARRLADVNFTSRYFVGHGADIGGKPDPLALYQELFCRMEGVRTWDWEDGDAQFLTTLNDNSLDFIHSSHCLEHLADPREGLKHWLRVVKPGGHLIITVPDEDMYEQGQFPSTFNRDHKWTFTVWKPQSWSDKSLNLFDLIASLDSAVDVIKIEQLTATYRYALPRYDQALSPVGECGIEIILRKRPAAEIEARGRWQRTAEQPSRELRIHLNQHRLDLQTLKRANTETAPFTNDTDI